MKLSWADRYARDQIIGRNITVAILAGLILWVIFG